ncbi:metal-dependent hydrolase family protein [Limobrevibacterium gyesilva]|uniref:Amidohydrolase family protein n=1 Tax=Limobrevibacterium gyesilva TaxID=2991712 RepID=A0AA41YM48_9PROT|nr:amidohydrolase family protein [Limobrevibacterium gyesilva]MCW3476429.1 amidohydrolase family protein [Limobrevibacterium gyesilva]
MTSYVFGGGRFLDPRQDALLEGIEVLVENGLVKEVSDRPIHAASAQRIDLRGRTLMPGLIDAHIHIVLTEVNLQLLSDVPLTLLAAKGSTSMRAMLMRGFTTLRDTGGADYGMKAAVEQGHFIGPRLFIAGAPLSQTGGHADHRKRTQSAFACACCSGLSWTARVADGVPDVIKAARDELRKGADHIKIMVSGGVASQADPLESLQYRMDEIEAAVEEAVRWGSYVCAHAYSAKAIERAVRGGVRTIEHGNLIDAPTAKLMAEKGAYIVPTLVAYDALKRRGGEYGLSDYSLAKNEMVLQGGLRSLELCRAAGVKIGFGSDLLGQLQNDHCNEFTIRGEVMRPQEVIRSATLVNAEIVRQEGKLGELIPGAHADLLVVDGDPYADLSVFLGDGLRMPAIMLGGRFVKNQLH